VVLGSGDGQVFQYQAGANEGRSVSQLLAFGLQGPALDVSVDGGSRFVAVVGEYRPGACRDGSAGNLLRIWDLKSAMPDLPVASTCLAARVNAIGPLTWKADKWVLPVYETRTKDDATTELMTFDFTCMACDASDERKSGLTPLMKERIEKYQPKELKVDRLKELYGI